MCRRRHVYDQPGQGLAGAALVLLPKLSISLLLGSPPETSVAFIVTRAVGVALLSLSAAYWLARNDSQSAAARGLVIAMLLYNGAFIFLLGYARIGLGLNGIGLFPGIYYSSKCPLHSSTFAYEFMHLWDGWHRWTRQIWFTGAPG